ncbi:hypothetical protein WR25_01414 [Diploscapter pachys]|uniref:Uncharacterized protein n=1 Tax=Diploscapter pachys TaxID=2018661 RepID=A0A2A2KEA0_9BILA|nr:hypothetical protein WR25_01414 [Diploscapter pachys]
MEGVRQTVVETGDGQLAGAFFQRLAWQVALGVVGDQGQVRCLGAQDRQQPGQQGLLQVVGAVKVHLGRAGEEIIAVAIPVEVL